MNGVLLRGGLVLAFATAIGTGGLLAQGPPQGRGGPPPTPPFDSAQGAPGANRGAQASAPIDLTGTWVSIVNEDWRWRMVTPPPGDYPGIMLTPAAQQIANAWDPKTDGSCLAFGAAALLRMPTRVRISWEDERTLKLETDNGQQTRRFYFDANAAPAGPPSLQGRSVAEWARTSPVPGGLVAIGGGPPRPGGSLKVVTTNLTGGWLRRNGVPYSDKATVTEFFDRFPVPNGGDWFVVTTVVEDPSYLLLQRMVTSSHFRKEPDDSKWAPRPCRP